MTSDPISDLPRGVIGVPGKWSNHAEVVRSLAECGEDYIYAGGLLTHLPSQRAFMLEEYEFEPRMRTAFMAAGAGRIPEKDLDRIAEHCRTVYISSDVGSVGTTRDLMCAAQVLLKAGGLGVKVESSGVAHSPSLWPLLCEGEERGAMLHAMVAFAGEGNSYYSCGMHHFGLRDVVVHDQLSPAEAGRLLEGFCGYQLMDEQELLDNDTFSLAGDQPRYVLNRQTCLEFDTTDLFFNPYGVWQLHRIDDCEMN